MRPYLAIGFLKWIKIRVTFIFSQKLEWWSMTHTLHIHEFLLLFLNGSRMTSFGCFLLPIFVVIATWHPTARSLRDSRQKLTHYYKCQWRTKMRSMLQWLQAGETWEDGTRRKKPQVDFCLWAKPTMRAEPLKCSNRKNTFGGHEKCVDTPLQPHHFLHSSNLPEGKTRFYG